MKGFEISKMNLADRTGLEPATSAVTGRHSNQLNYRSFSVGAAKIGEKIIQPKTNSLPFQNSSQIPTIYLEMNTGRTSHIYSDPGKIKVCIAGTAPTRRSACEIRVPVL
jgi:hypothetical protein